MSENKGKISGIMKSSNKCWSQKFNRYFLQVPVIFIVSMKAYMKKNKLKNKKKKERNTVPKCRW